MARKSRATPFLTYFRHGEMLLLLRPNNAGAQQAAAVDPGHLDPLRDILRLARGVGGDGNEAMTVRNNDPFHREPFRATSRARAPLLLQRANPADTVVLHCVNLASWVPNPARLNPERAYVDFDTARRTIRDVGVAVRAVNQAVEAERRQNRSIAIGPDYTLVAAAPNWLAEPMEGC
jgi:hypothetical protein